MCQIKRHWFLYAQLGATPSIRSLFGYVWTNSRGDPISGQFSWDSPPLLISSAPQVPQRLQAGEHVAAAGNVVPTYIAAIPTDPSTGDNGNTDYTVYVNTDGRVVASASGELTGSISIQR